MADPRTAYLSAYRGARAPGRAVAFTSRDVPSPVGAASSTSMPDQRAAAWSNWIDQQRLGMPVGMPPGVKAFPAMAGPGMTPARAPGGTAAGQAQALRSDQPPLEWQALPAAARTSLEGGYTSGGFEGMRNAVGADAWYNLPSYLRTRLMAGAAGL